MRFTTLFCALTAISTAVAVPAAAPARKAISPQKGPKAMGRAPDYVVRVKDLHPHSQHGDLEIGHIWITPNTTVTKPRPQKRQEGDPNTSEGGDTEYDSVQCWWGASTWISQNTLYSVKNSICNYFDAYVQPGYGYGVDIAWYQWSQDPYTGAYTNILDQNGKPAGTWWKLVMSQVQGWNWNACYDTFWYLINHCPGSNPDSAGGELNDYYELDTWYGKILGNDAILTTWTL
ncbi:hypothetical protein TWF694_006308 [Orbilia ellipsospora]|uniref:Uncharacterized protein n=1 Tax=Orbilia ellipsospora TaxID=2528407 RepID=A0AAV9XJP3_9PEZI